MSLLNSPGAYLDVVNILSVRGGGGGGRKKKGNFLSEQAVWRFSSVCLVFLSAVVYELKSSSCM